MSTPLSANQKRYLRGLAHSLKPVILMGGKGLTDALMAELELALEQHELVKVRLAADARATREELVATLVERSGAQLVQRIGHVACLYRRHPDAALIALPR